MTNIANGSISSSSSFQIKIVSQPANLTDFRVLDLGFHSSTDNLRIKTMFTTVVGMGSVENRVYDKYSFKNVSDDIFTFQRVFKRLMKVEGYNNSRIRRKKSMD